MEPSSVSAAQPSFGWRYLWLGLVLALAGPVLYFCQIMLAKRLFVPWYMPALGTLGAILLLGAVFLMHGWWRVIPGVLFLLFGLVAFGEWFFLLSFSKVPPYAGPAQVDEPFPRFVAGCADGLRFDENDLKTGQATVLVFFRGRW